MVACEPTGLEGTGHQPRSPLGEKTMDAIVSSMDGMGRRPHLAMSCKDTRVRRSAVRWEGAVVSLPHAYSSLSLWRGDRKGDRAPAECTSMCGVPAVVDPAAGVPVPCE